MENCGSYSPVLSPTLSDLSCRCFPTFSLFTVF